MAKGAKQLLSKTVERIRDANGAAAFAIAVGVAPSRPAAGKPARLSDGEGLYLLVERTGAARWLFLFRRDGKLKEMGLGGLSKVSLKAAREKAADARNLIGRGVNPIAAKRAAAAIPTFGEMADDLIAEVGKGFKNPKHLASWQRAIGAPRPIRLRRAHRWVEGKPRPSFADALRPRRVDQITPDDVLAVLKPLWSTRHETASRLRGQIAQVFDAAKAAGHRSGENPAAWGGNLKHRLAARRKLTKGHHAALPYEDLPAFMADLRTHHADSADALEFLILNWSRASEVLEMPWGEVDLEARLWTIPGGRMKGGREHRVPLSAAAVDILKRRAAGADGSPDSYVFARGSGRKALSEAAMRSLLARMGYAAFTPHGFRSTARDWCGDATGFPRDLAEQALAHAVTSEVERAYRRRDGLERRRRLMEAWAGYCAGGAAVIELARSA